MLQLPNAMTLASNKDGFTDQKHRDEEPKDKL